MKYLQACLSLRSAFEGTNLRKLVLEVAPKENILESVLLLSDNNRDHITGDIARPGML